MKKIAALGTIIFGLTMFFWQWAPADSAVGTFSDDQSKLRAIASQAAKASGHVSIWLKLPAGQTIYTSDKFHTAHLILSRLLAEGTSIWTSECSDLKDYCSIAEFKASGWAYPPGEQERQRLLETLMASWKNDIQVRVGDLANKTSSPWGKKEPSTQRLRVYEVSEDGFKLLKSNPGAAYDGNLRLPSNVSANSVQIKLGPATPTETLSLKPSSLTHAKIKSATPQTTASAVADKSEKKILVFDPDAIDRSVDPCTDFYQYSCGAWLKNNPIPAERSSWWRDSPVDENIHVTLRDILQEAAAKRKKRDADQQKIGDFYASCMDEKGINKKGAKPLKPEFTRINAMKNQGDLASVVARLHTIGVNALFTFGPDQDFADATQMIAEADQGGISLPDRKYYLEDKFKKELEAYKQHVQNMFGLLGELPKTAAAHAATVVRIETELAKVSMTLEDRRDPNKVYHKMPLSNLETLTPAFNWGTYLTKIGMPGFSNLNVMVPDFFKGMNDQIQSTPIEDWKTYLRWRVLHDQASLLSSDFVNENFNFFGKILSGKKELKPRWKRCVDMSDGALGEALGRIYVERAFGKVGKERALEMIHEIEKAMESDVAKLPWMTEETKKQALVKLHAVANKIGYPDKWRDYGKLKIARGDALGNGQRASMFEFRRQLAKIGKPVDRNEWFMTPPTINAYYNPQMNDINFPAGILQPPYFDKDADAAENLGSIGAIIGHELTHGFDDQGRQFDASGNLRDWWTETDGKKFGELAKAFVDQYSQYTVKDPQDPSKPLPVNGEMTLGENIADNGGLRLSYMAWLSTLDGKTPNSSKGGFTPAQRFFISYGQSWCANMTDEAAKKQVATDYHSPSHFRVNGVVSNMPEFQQTFQCPKDSPMVRPNPNRVW